MRFIWCIFVVLAIVENSFTATSLNNIAANTIGRITGTRADNCANNYKNNPDLKPSGYLYTLYTSCKFRSNEVAKYDQVGNDNILARTTSDGKCCSTSNITLGEETNPLTIISDPDCSPKIATDSGQQKFIASNTDADGSCCFIIWICRKARKGVYAICDERIISDEQTEWIHKQYDNIDLKPIKVEQSADYKGQKCFKNLPFCTT